MAKVNNYLNDLEELREMVDVIRMILGKDALYSMIRSRAFNIKNHEISKTKIQK